jgi:hypothetical protein
LRVTVQVLEPPDANDAGLQAREDNVKTVNNEIDAVKDAPFRVAVIITIWLAVTGPAVAVKVVEEVPAGTVTADGMVRAGLLSARATIAPPVGAASLSPTVQVEDAGQVRTLGLQLSWVKPMTRAVIVPPVARIEIVPPVGELPRASVTPIEVPVVVVESVTVTTATTPLCMVLVLRPVSKHMYEPGLLAHTRVLPAAVAAAPALAVMATILEGE